MKCQKKKKKQANNVCSPGLKLVKTLSAGALFEIRLHWEFVLLMGDGCVHEVSAKNGEFCTDHVHNSSECFRANWNCDWATSIDHLLPSDQSLGGIQRNSSDSGVS